MSNLICSFCGKREDASDDVFTIGRTGCICSTCADQVAVVAQKEEKKREEEVSESIPNIDWKAFRPHKLKSYVDQFVVGQEKAKKALCVGIYNHYKRLAWEQKQADTGVDREKEEITIDKSNILMIGDTGVGKTYLIRTIAKFLDVPFAITDATALTQAGYVGEDVENMIANLLRAADYNVERTKRGIVYLDEVDKIARMSADSSKTRDVSGEGVQQALLKMLEGSCVNVSPQGGRKHPEQKMVNIDTRNILFICGGSFEGIRSIIKNRVSSSSIGFQTDQKEHLLQNDKDLLPQLTAADLRSYGMIPELIGRLPIKVCLTPLTRDMLKEILQNVKNSLVQQYEKLFAMEEIKLSFTEDAVESIVDRVFKLKLGARGLRSVLENILTPAMFTLPGKATKDHELLIDKAYINKGLDTLNPQDKPKTSPTKAEAPRTHKHSLKLAPT